MKRNLLAIAIPALLVAGAANAAEVYNKDGSTLDVTGRVHAFGEHKGQYFEDTTSLRLGLLGSSEITKTIKAFGKFEYETAVGGNEGEDEKAGVLLINRYAFAGVDFGKLGSISYGKNDGVLTAITDYTDTLPENGAPGGDHIFLAGRTAQVTTYSNSGLVNGLSFALQYVAGTNYTQLSSEPYGRAYGLNAQYDVLNTGVTVGVGYAQSIKTKGTDIQGITRTGIVAVKYDANNIYVAALYAHGENQYVEGDTQFMANGYEAVAKYTYKDITPVVGYYYHKQTNGTVLANYTDVGVEYALNKNLTAVVDYQINLEKDTKNVTQVGVVYKF